MRRRRHIDRVMRTQSTDTDVAQLLQHSAWVRRLARGLVRDDALADDLGQEAWLAALRPPPRACALGSSAAAAAAAGGWARWRGWPMVATPRAGGQRRAL